MSIGAALHDCEFHDCVCVSAAVWLVLQNGYGYSIVNCVQYVITGACWAAAVRLLALLLDLALVLYDALWLGLAECAWCHAG